MQTWPHVSITRVSLCDLVTRKLSTNEIQRKSGHDNRNSTSVCTRVTLSAHTTTTEPLFFFFCKSDLFISSNDNGTDDMKAQGRAGGRKRGVEFIQHMDIAWWGGSRGASKSTKWSKRYRIKNFNFFFHIYIYIGLIILFNYAKQGMPFFPFILSLGFP